MTNTGRTHNLVGEPVRADGFWGRSDGLHTVQVIYSNFTGEFGVQGTLETDPKPQDWFFINLNSFSTVLSPYVRFPENPLSLTGDTGDTGTRAFTFRGNFVYLRAVLNRDYIPEPSPTADVTGLGQIDRVLLSAWTTALLAVLISQKAFPKLDAGCFWQDLLNTTNKYIRSSRVRPLTVVFAEFR